MFRSEARFTAMQFIYMWTFCLVSSCFVLTPLHILSMKINLDIDIYVKPSSHNGSVTGYL